MPWWPLGALIPLAGLGLFLFAAVVMADDVAALGEYKTASLASGADKHVIASGMVREGAPLRSPGGTEGAAWITWLTRKKGKRTTIECVLAHAAELQIEGVGPVDFARQGDAVAVGTNSLRGRLEDPLPALVLGESRTPKDLGAVGRACAGQLAARGVAASETVAWEQVLSAGTTVHVTGCRAPDGRIVPCGNGLDLLSIWPIEHHSSVHRDNALIFASVGMCGWLLILAGVGIGALSSRPKLNKPRGRSS